MQKRRKKQKTWHTAFSAQCLYMEATNYLVWPIRLPPNLEIAVVRGAKWRLNRAGVQIRDLLKQEPRRCTRNRESDSQATWSDHVTTPTEQICHIFFYVSDQCSAVPSLAHTSILMFLGYRIYTKWYLKRSYEYTVDTRHIKCS